MKTKFLFIALIALFASCSETKKEAKKIEEKAPVIEMEEDLVEIKDGVYTEYYPGKKAVKFQGEQDKDGFRHGIYLFMFSSWVTSSR